MAAAAIAVMLMAAVKAHPMTYKGIVGSVDATSLQVKAMDDMNKKESTITFRVTAKTKIWRGDRAMTLAEAKVQKGERVAITIDMDEATRDAEEIKLAAVAEPAPASAKDTVKVTGCVAKSSDGTHFQLTKSSIAGQKTIKTYDLSGGDFKSHVGHRVAVTGTVQPPTMEMSKPMTAKQMAQMHGTLLVEGVAMISASCR